jgi:hypothetical protein
MKHVKIGFSRKIKYIAVILILATALLVSLGIYLNSKTGLNSPVKTTSIESWYPFKSEVGNFKTYFPEPNPQKTSDVYFPLEGFNGQRHAIVYCVRNGAYCIEVGIYPPAYNLRSDISSINTFENVTLQKFENPQPISTSSGEFLGNPYIDFAFTSANQFYKYRVFAIEDNSYAISLSSSNSNFDTFNKFVNSFSIINLKYNNNLSWKPLTSAEWNFKTIFPYNNFTAEVTSPNDQVLKGITYSSNTGSINSYSILISQWTHEKNLQSLLDGTLAYLNSTMSVNYKIISSKNSTCSGKPCLIFLAQENDSKGFLYYKGVIILGDNNTIYSIYGIVDNESYFSNIDKIINSFSLISK